MVDTTLTPLDEIDDLHAEARRGRPAAGQDPAKRQQIIEGARQVFIDMGFDAASMNDITRAAGVSKGTIYVYFRNKEELFEALIDEERQKIFTDLYDSLTSGGPPRETLTRFATILGRKITSPQVLRAQRTVIGICERMPELGARFYARGPKTGHARLRAYLEGAVARGQLSMTDVDLAAYQFLELATAGIYRQCLFGYRARPPSDAELERVAAGAVDMFIRAYAPLSSAAG